VIETRVDSCNSVILPSFIAAGAALTLAALTPAKVTDVESNSSEIHSAKLPSVIYVNSFFVSTASSKSNDTNSDEQRPHLLGRLRGGEDNTVIGRHREEQKEETLAKLPGVLQKALIEDLSNSIAPAAAGNGAHASRKDCWVITGQFLEVDTGSSAMQAGVGFGAGKSHVEVRAKVYLASDLNTPFLTFDSEGASGHMPGAVMTKNPYVAAAKFVMSKREPEQEAKKVAKAISAEIGKFMTAQRIPTLKSMKESGSAPAPSSSDNR